MTGIALFFSFSALIQIHELLHGIALKFTGAKEIHYGAYLRKFIFYAEADSHVLNKLQFTFVALMPLVIVKLLTVGGMLFFLSSPISYFMIIMMVTHSFFCAGDIGLFNVFCRFNDVYTYDVRKEKKSYYFKRI